MPAGSTRLSDLPVELLPNILGPVLEDYYAWQTSRALPKPDETYLNRYTPPARVFRRVCRLWRSFVDHPSNYRARLTSVILALDKESDYARNPNFLDIERFRAYLMRSRSLISVALFPCGDRELGDILSRTDWTSKKKARIMNLISQELDYVADLNHRVIAFSVGAPNLLHLIEATGPFHILSNFACYYLGVSDAPHLDTVSNYYNFGLHLTGLTGLY